MAASSSSFLRAFWLVLPIVSVFDRALDRVGESNEPPRKRKRLSLRRKENKPITGDGGWRVGAPSGSLSLCMVS